MSTNLLPNFALCVFVSELDLKGYRIGLEAAARARCLDSHEGKHGLGRQPAELKVEGSNPSGPANAMR